MLFRPLQLGEIRVPFEVELSVDTQALPGFIEKSLGDGGISFQTKSKLNTKNISLLCTYVQRDAKTETDKKAEFLEFYHKIEQANQTDTVLYAIGQDDRIYKTKAKIGVCSFNYTDIYSNGFAFQIPLFAYEVLWTECTATIFYDLFVLQLDNANLSKFNSEFSFNYGTPKIPTRDRVLAPTSLYELRPPASFNTSAQNIQNKIWNTQNAGVAITGTGSTSFDTSDIVNESNTFVITTSSGTQNNTIAFTSKNLSQFVGNTPLCDFDCVEFNLKVSNLSNLETFSLRILTDVSNYIEYTNLVGYIQYLADGEWGRVKIPIVDFTRTGNIDFSNITSILITQKNTGSACTLKINGLYFAKRFGLGMNYVEANSIYIDNPTLKGKLELWVLFASNATTKILAIEDTVINCNQRVLVINDGGYACGPDLVSLSQIGVFDTTRRTPVVSLTLQSDQPVFAYYFLNDQYI